MATEKDLPHRTWSALRELWLEHVPADLTPADIDSLSRVVHAHGHPIDRAPIPLVSGLREQALSEALFVRAKSLYCLECGIRSNDEGFATWSSMTMYEACFFAAKAFCYLLGIRDLSRDSNIYVDLFFQEYKKGRVIFDGHKAYLMKGRLTHSSLWKIFPRLIRTFTLDLQFHQEGILELRKFDFDSFSRERNRILYKSFSWSREDSIETSDMFAPVSYIDNRRFISGENSFAEYYSGYYLVAVAVNNLIEFLIRDLGTLAPALVSEVELRPGPRILTSFAMV
jgi:hypothetical protein